MRTDHAVFGCNTHTQNTNAHINTHFAYKILLFLLKCQNETLVTVELCNAHMFKKRPTIPYEPSINNHSATDSIGA